MLANIHVYSLTAGPICSLILDVAFLLPVSICSDLRRGVPVQLSIVMAKQKKSTLKLRIYPRVLILKVYRLMNRKNMKPVHCCTGFIFCTFPATVAAKLIRLLSCQPRVTMTSCLVYKVIRDLESIDHLCINPIHRIGLIHK